MSTTGFLGMRGTGNWSNEERPKSFREGMLLLNPNGAAPLTAITSKGKSQRTTDPEFKWFSKNLAAQGGTITASYTEASLTNVITTAAFAAGITVYCKMAEAVTNHFRIGHTVKLVYPTTQTDVFGIVTGKMADGASSYVAVKLKTAGAANEVGNATYLDIIGSANAEGANIPEAISYDPDKFYNYTQIFRTPLDITRTQRLTTMRTGDPYQEAKREALLYHGIELEMATLLGERSEVTGSNNKPERTTDGALAFLRTNNSANEIDYASGTSNTWLAGGEDWLDESLEVLFRYGRTTKLALCGSLALLGIQKLVKSVGQFTFEPLTAAYGIQVVRWTTPYGEIMLKTHPLFTHKSYLRKNIMILEPENMNFRYITDTQFKKDMGQSEAGYQAYDGTKEEYLTEAGWEWHHAETMMYLTSVGDDGTA